MTLRGPSEMTAEAKKEALTVQTSALLGEMDENQLQN